MGSESSSKRRQADVRVSGQLVTMRGAWSVCPGAGMSPGCVCLRNIIEETILEPEITEVLIALSFYRGEGGQGVRRLWFPACRERVFIQNYTCDKRKKRRWPERNEFYESVLFNCLKGESSSA